MAGEEGERRLQVRCMRWVRRQVKRQEGVIYRRRGLLVLACLGLFLRGSVLGLVDLVTISDSLAGVHK